MSKEFILLSGGLDSTLLAYDLKQRKSLDELEAIYIDHGQLAANKEKEAACRVAEELNISFKVIDISGLWPSFQDVINRERFHVMTSSGISPSAGILIGANYAAWAGAKKLYIGLVKEDIDGRPWLEDLIGLYNESLSCIKPSLKGFPPGGSEFEGFEISAPFSSQYKAEIIKSLYEHDEENKISDDAGIKSLIASSWSCQFSDESECGECFICKLKSESIEKA